MRVTFVYDVEDYITPEEVELDDLLKMLADTLIEEKLIGSFFVIGEKMRCLRDRGRQDVLDSLRKNDVGSHINMGSIHPTVTERMEHADWTNGVARMLADEVAGIREMSEILGAPLGSLARHGGSYSPQLVNALGKASLPFVYSPAELPNHHITWFCNAVNFREAFVAFQNSYFTRDDFLAMEKRFFAEYEKIKDADWMGIFHSHPCAIKMSSFGCQNYYKGIYTPPEEWVIPEVREEFDFDALKENWAFHCARLREDPRFDVRSISQLAEEFGTQAESAGTAEIQALSRMAAAADEPFFTDRFTAAEIVDLLARAFLHRAKHGVLPESLPRRDVLGPTQTPLSTPTARRLTPEGIARLARGIDAAVELGGTAPSVIRTGEGTLGSMGEVGLGSAMNALGRALTAKIDATVQPIPVAPHPKEGDEIVERLGAEFQKWKPHRQDLDWADIKRLTALQSWTLKPAWPDAPPDFKN